MRSVVDRNVVARRISVLPPQGILTTNMAVLQFLEIQQVASTGNLLRTEIVLHCHLIVKC